MLLEFQYVLVDANLQGAKAESSNRVKTKPNHAPEAFSGIHPGAVGDRRLSFVPFVRCAYFCGTVGYFLWLDQFPIKQTLLYIWGGLNAVAIIGMILNVADSSERPQHYEFTLLHLQLMDEELAASLKHANDTPCLLTGGRAGEKPLAADGV